MFWKAKVATESAPAMPARPFALLQAIENRARAVARGRNIGREAEKEWTGMAFRVASEIYIADRNNIREIMTPVPLAPLPGAKSWLIGVANVRGQLIPVTDLAAFAGLEPIQMSRTTRLIRINHDRNPVGLLVDEVRGFRRIHETEREATPRESALRAWIRGCYQVDRILCQHVDLHALVESTLFLDAAAG
ncbi:twitching motility protein PilI [mine drainage metagenome]|uniref:Twitching motility protein PilI n=1 Tax=mine drainage metagenome TaxID=410659 RepID=T1C2Y3_9ZZZZ